jgi:CubicO group peptidase (beta-lactamase class C family)
MSAIFEFSWNFLDLSLVSSKSNHFCFGKRHFMSRKVARTILPLAFLGLLGAAGAQTLNTPEIDRFVADAMKNHHVPGVGLALVMNGKVVYVKGYGVRDVKTKTPVNANTLFSIGSVSKSFTSLGAMQLVEAGKLSLNTKVKAVLPELRFSDADKGASLTLQNLLSHSSGMGRADDLWYLDKTVKTRADMLGTVAKIPFNEPIGTTWQYCNQNFVIAGAMLEKTTGKSWEDYTRQNIFAPLGMKRSVFEPSEAAKDGNYASGNSVGLLGAQAMPAFERYVIAGPAGSIISSAAEMGNYAAFQLSGGTWNNQKILSKTLLETMHKTQIEIEPGGQGTPGLAFPSYGLGWFSEEYRGLKIIEHGGNIDGFSAEVQLVPSKGLGVVILTNLNGANRFLSDVRLGLTERLVGMNPLSQFEASPLNAQLEAAKSFKPDFENLKALEGKYALVTGDTLNISLKDNGLIATQGGMSFPMIPVSKSQFLIDALGNLISLEFKLQPNGLVWVYQDDQPVGVRLPSAPGGTATIKELSDPAKTYSLSLPASLQVVRQTEKFAVMQSAAPEATVIVATTKSQPELEASVKAVLNQFDPNFKQTPNDIRQLPTLNGIVWTQYVYRLPGDQTLVAVATSKGDTTFVIVVQLKTADLNALVPTINEMLMSFKILI